MLAYYAGDGVNALISIVLNLVILLGLVAYIPVTMTLPGIAGLISDHWHGCRFERVDFRAHQGRARRRRGARAAVAAASTASGSTIIDTHVTSLIAAAFLFQFGTHPDSWRLPPL